MHIMQRERIMEESKDTSITYLSGVKQTLFSLPFLMYETIQRKNEKIQCTLNKRETKSRQTAKTAVE